MSIDKSELSFLVEKYSSELITKYLQIIEKCQRGKR